MTWLTRLWRWLGKKPKPIDRGCTSLSSDPKGGKCTNPHCVRR